MGNFQVGLQVLVADLLFLCQRMPGVHNQHVVKLGHKLAHKLLFLQKIPEIALVSCRIPDDSQLVVRAENVIDGTERIGLLVKDLHRRILRQAQRKTGKGIRNVACPGDRNGKFLLLPLPFQEDFFYLLNLIEDVVRILHQALSVGCQDHSLGRSFKDSDPEGGLQLLDGTADVGLCHKQLLCRLADRAASGNLVRIFQIQDVQHIAPFSASDTVKTVPAAPLLFL